MVTRVPGDPEATSDFGSRRSDRFSAALGRYLKARARRNSQAMIRAQREMDAALQGPSGSQGGMLVSTGPRNGYIKARQRIYGGARRMLAIKGGLAERRTGRAGRVHWLFSAGYPVWNNGTARARRSSLVY